MSVNYAELVLGADTRGLLQAKRDLAGVREEGARTEQGVTGSMGKVSKSFAGAAGAAAKFAAGAAAAAAATMSIGAAVGVIRQFEGSMSQVAAITGATAGELAALRDIAKELGSTTEFSASQAADGLRFLGMAGFSAAESIKAIPAVLDLATAASIGLAESADIASNVLSGFGLEAGAAAEVADVLAAASSRANTSVSQLGSAMSTVAPISSALGIDLADTAAAIGVLSDAGVQGEKAGTALRGVLASLAGPTAQAQEALAKYGLTAAQVNPESVALADIFATLRDRGLSTADAMVIFGREAASGALVLAGASERVGEFGEELRGAEGAASDVASIMRDNLGGAANTLMSTVQGLAIALGEAGLTAVLIAALEGATALVRGLTMLVEGIGAVIDFVHRHTTATEAVTEAMQLQAAQAGDTKTATDNVAEASRGAAAAALQEARAQMAVIDAHRERRAESVRSSEEYKNLQSAVNLAAAELDMLYQMQSRDGGKFAPMTAEAAAAMDDLKTQLVLARRAQDELLESANFTSSEYNKLQGDVDKLEAELAAAAKAAGGVTDEVIELDPILTNSAVTAARLELALGSIDMSNAVTGAKALADNLNISLHAAMQMMGLLGAAAQSANEAVIFDPRDPRYDADAAAYAARLERISGLMEDLEVTTGGASSATKDFTSATKASGGAANAASKDMKALADEIERLEESADPAKKFRREMEKLDTLLENGLSDGAYTKAVQDLNAEFVETSPILSSVNDAFGQMVDYMFSGFRDGMKGILNIFVNTLKQMAAMALKNRITIGLGLSATGGAGAAAAGIPGGGGISSLFGGSGFLGLGGGAGSLFGGSGLLGLGGGSSIFGLGAGSGLATALGGGAFGAAASVALPVLGIGLALGALFKKTEVLVAEGVRARIEGASLELDSYEKTKTNNGLGISSGFKRDFERLDDAVQSAVQTRLDATIDALEAFGFGTDLTGFSFSKRTEIKDGETFEGESEEVIREALDAVVTFLADGALEVFQKTGESISETLDRMTNSLTLANDSLDFFGGTLLPISLEGAAAAAALTDLYGGLEAFAASGQFLFENFTTTEQKLERATAELNAAFEQLGVDVPKTHQAYLDLINSQDLMTERGRELHAGLSALAPLFVTVAKTADEAAAETAEYEAGLKESIRLRAEEKTAMLAANQARFAAIRVAEKEARRAQQQAELEATAAANEATFAENVNRYAAQVSSGIRSMEDVLRNVPGATKEAIEAAYQNIGVVDRIDAYFNQPLGTVGGGAWETRGGVDIFNQMADEILSTAMDNAVAVFDRAGEDISRFVVDYGDGPFINIQQVRNAVAALEGLTEARSGELAAMEQAVGTLDTLYGALAALDEGRFMAGANAVNVVTKSADMFRNAMSELAGEAGDSSFDTATRGIDKLTEVFKALGPAMQAGSAINQVPDAYRMFIPDSAFNDAGMLNAIKSVSEQAKAIIEQAIVAPIEEQIAIAAPELKALAGAMFAPIAALASEISEGDVQAYGDAILSISNMFASGKIDLDTYQASFGLLNSALDGSLQPVDDLADAVSGLSDEATSLQERFDRLTAELAGPDALREYELGLLPDDAKALQEAVWGLEKQLADAAEAARQAEAALQQENSLKEQLATLRAQIAGRDAERQLELDRLLSDSARETQREIYRLTDTIEDNAEAARLADKALQERLGLERRILELNGDTAAIRDLELAALEPSNRELQKLIYAREDEIAATEAMKSALDGLASAVNAESQAIAQAVEEAERGLEAAVNALDRIFQQLEDKVTDALSALSDAIDAESAALEQSVADAKDTVSNALSVLGDALDAETQRINDVLGELISQRDDLNAQLFPQNDVPEFDFEVRDLLSEGLDLARQLSEIARDVLGQNVQIAEQQRQAALAQLRGMIAAGAIDAENVADIAQRASEFNSRQYATLEDMQFDQLVTANTINELSKLQEKLAQEAQAEEDARVAEARDLAFEQLDLLEAQIVEQQNALMALDDIRSQFDIATDVLLSIDEAIAGVEAAQAALATAEQNAADRQAELDLLRQDFGILIDAVKSVEDAVDAVNTAQFNLDEAKSQAQNRVLQLDAIRSGFVTLSGETASLEVAIGAVETAVRELDTLSDYAEARESELEQIRNQFELIGSGIEDALAQAASTTASALSAVLQAVGDMDGAQAVIDQAGSGSSGGSGTSGGSSNPAPPPGYEAAIAEIERQRSYFQGELDAAQVNLVSAQNNRDSIIGDATSLYNELMRIYDRQINYTATIPEISWYNQNLPVYESLLPQIAPAKSAVEAAEAEVRRLQNALNQVNAAAANIPSYASGTDFHPGGWAKLHENEMVNLPRGTSVSTASEVRQMAEQNKRLEQQNEQNAAELRQMRRFLKTLADIEEDRRAEELAKAKEEAAA